MARFLNEKSFESSGDYFESYRDESVGVINLKGNVFEMAMDLPLKEEFFGKIRLAYRIPEIKVLLILSSESALGEDRYIQFEKALTESTGNAMKLFREENALCQYVRLIYDSDKIIVSAVRGSVIGAFLGTILAADHRIASESTTFSFLDVMHEVLPQGALSFFLPRYVGLVKTKKILLESESISAAKAYELGLVDDVIADDNFEEKCIEIARKMSQIPSGIVRLTKRLIGGELKELENCFQIDSQLIRSSTGTL